MNIHGTDTAAQDGITPVVARQITEERRLGTLGRYFGLRALTFENAVYDFLRRFAPEYTGGYWQFYELSNGGFYMAPEGGPFRFTVDTNGFEGTLSAAAAGITVCLFAYSHLSFHFNPDNTFADHFNALRAFAAEHPEAGAIFATID
jgi:hypothetical protein